MKKLVIITAIISLILIMQTTTQEDTLRFRVIANSNSNYDQNIKKEIVNELLPVVNKNYKSIEEARYNINNNIEEYNRIIDDIYEKYNIKSNYTINYGLNYFPRKQIYKEGNYESLVIKLGESKGKNFWCVLFPPICNMKSDNYEYKSFFKELIDKIKNK